MDCQSIAGPVPEPARETIRNAGRWRAWWVPRVRAPRCLGLGLFMFVLALGATSAQSSLGFVEETASAGVAHVYDGPWEYFTGGGVAALDCDGDADLDLYVAGGAGPAGLYANVGERGGPLRFAALARPELELDGVTGAYPLDVDDDAIVDLVVLRVGENVVLRGRGDCRFERANERWGVAGGDAWTVGFAAVWERDEIRPTLAFGNYIDRSQPGAPWGTCHANELHRPAGARYGTPIPLSPGWCNLSLRFSDWERDGVPDLWASHDRQYFLAGGDRSGGEQLWRVAPGEPPYLYTPADGWNPLQIWGMGVAVADLTGDARPEFFLTSMTDQKLRILAEGAAGPAYEDGAFARGMTVHRPFTGDDTRPSTGWHAQFEDVDHDGWIDLFVAKGNVEAMPEFAQADPNNLLLGRPDGTFVEAAVDAGVLSFERGRGALLADLNLDGRLDLVVVNRGAPVQLWRNVGEGLGRWAMLRLRQDAPNVTGIGAWLEVDAGDRTVRRELFVGGGHASGAWGFTHVGLGDAERFDVRVTWPDGEVEAFVDLPAEAFLVLTRGRGAERAGLSKASP